MKKISYSTFLSSMFRSFDITHSDIQNFTKEFHNDMGRGLRDQSSSLKMFPAYIDRPKGSEKGTFITLDVGGTNFRILEVKLDGKGNAREMHVDRYVIPKVVRHGTGVQMFNYIAKSIVMFAEKYNIQFVGKRTLGFTFSFPMKQTSIVTGMLVNWTKGFSATGVVKKNVVTLLSESLERYGIGDLKITALANDTVGTLAAGAVKYSHCDVGVIFGTGTNACYRENIKNIKKLGQRYKKNGHMIVNIEWGNFDKLPTNFYDAKLDKSTNNTGKQKMEKMISGMYLGEITRLVLSDLIKHKYIFVNRQAKFPRGSFNTRHMSLVESDHSKDLSKIKDYLEIQGILDTSIAERNLFKEISQMVSIRAARVSAAAISAVVTWMDPDITRQHTIAIDGTLYERHPGFSKAITSTLEEIHGDRSRRIKLRHARDGSGVGVAILAAVAKKK